MHRFLIFLYLCFLASAVRAQDIYTRTEFGVEFSTIRQAPPGGGGKNYPGFGGRFDWNLTRRLALEAQVDFFPEHSGELFYRQGGQTIQAVAGIRAKVIQTRRLSVFGLVRPGVFHFTDVLFENNSSAGFSVQPANYFVLNLGGGIEYYISHRWVLRAEIEGDPYRVSNSGVSLGSGNGSEFVPGTVVDTTRLSFGIGYRPGAWIENEPEHAVSGRWETGPLFSTMIIAREGATVGVRAEPGFGGYADYKLYKVFYLDGDFLYFPRGTDTSGPHDGGQILEGLFGVKGGIRRNHFGIFGKVRPGFTSYSKALSSVTTNGNSLAYGYGRSTNIALDLGGIVEFYPAEHSTIRLEAGDTHLFFADKTINANGQPFPAPGGDLRHTIQFIAGYGWRF